MVQLILFYFSRNLNLNYKNYSNGIQKDLTEKTLNKTFVFFFSSWYNNFISYSHMNALRFKESNKTKHSSLTIMIFSTVSLQFHKCFLTTA